MTRRAPDPRDVPLKVGELARRAGLSVRALHHYEEIGLLVPSARTDAGHRLYARADVERLARITALTALGFSLDQVRRVLDQDDEDATPARLVERHLARAREALDEQRALCARLERIRDALDDGRDDVDTLIETVEVMTMIERYYTQEQLDQLAARREAIGEDAIREVEREWQDLFAALEAAMDAGTPPDDPAVAALARRSRELVAMFTGGDPGIAASLNKMYAEQPVQKIHPSFDPAIFAYLRQATDALPPE